MVDVFGLAKGFGGGGALVRALEGTIPRGLEAVTMISIPYGYAIILAMVALIIGVAWSGYAESKKGWWKGSPTGVRFFIKDLGLGMTGIINIVFGFVFVCMETPWFKLVGVMFIIIGTVDVLIARD